MPTSLLNLRALLGLVGQAAGIVLVAFVVGRFRSTSRKRLRRLVVLFVLQIVAYAVAVAMVAAGETGSWINVPWHLAWLLRTLLLINLVAIVLFDLALPALRLPTPHIFHELTVGAAYAVTLIAFLRFEGVNPSSLVVTSAVITAIIAFSLQATLGNVFGGIALQLDDSIHVGDWVRLDATTEGLVKEIGWRHTVIETRNWDTLIVPNASLMSQNITILGQREGRPVQHRMWIRFNVDFRHSPSEVIDAVERGLCAAPIPGVASEPLPNCICLDFAQLGGESFAVYAVRYWLVDLAADDPTSSAVRTRIYTALRRAEIPLAVPAATVFMEQHDPARAERASCSAICSGASPRWRRSSSSAP
jgi:small-conductance mechanosensitive channel